MIANCLMLSVHGCFVSMREPVSGTHDYKLHTIHIVAICIAMLIRPLHNSIIVHILNRFYSVNINFADFLIICHATINCICLSDLALYIRGVPLSPEITYFPMWPCVRRIWYIRCYHILQYFTSKTVVSRVSYSTNLFMARSEISFWSSW